MRYCVNTMTSRTLFTHYYVAIVLLAAALVTLLGKRQWNVELSSNAENQIIGNFEKRQLEVGSKHIQGRILPDEDLNATMKKQRRETISSTTHEIRLLNLGQRASTDKQRKGEKKPTNSARNHNTKNIK